jgi:hypothetical protein
VLLVPLVALDACPTTEVLDDEPTVLVFLIVLVAAGGLKVALLPVTVLVSEGDDSSTDDLLVEEDSVLVSVEDEVCWILVVDDGRSVGERVVSGLRVKVKDGRKTGSSAGFDLAVEVKANSELGASLVVSCTFPVGEGPITTTSTPVGAGWRVLAGESGSVTMMGLGAEPSSCS